MFSQREPIPVYLKQVYELKRSPHEHAVAANMAAGTPHTFTLSLRGEHATMVVDNLEETTCTFMFAGVPYGCFSLVSNATAPEPGAFRFIRLRVDDEVLLDLDFRTVDAVTDLEQYFDCFYFPDLDRNRIATPARIEQYWDFNERGHLKCIRKRSDRIPINDCGPTCVLTLRHPPIGDFDAEIGFEQCWRRYGVIFGCEKRKFPYYSMLKTWSIAGVQGGFVYVGADSAVCCVRGALQQSKNTNIHLTTVNEAGFSSYGFKRNKPSHDTFRSKHQTTLPYHTLTFCKEGNITYHFEDKKFTEQAGTVLYLPPNTRCRLEGNPDQIVRVEFECASPIALSPAIYNAERPEMLGRMFDELMETWYGTLPGKEYRSLAVFYRIMAEITRPLFDGATVAVRVATQYIDTHFTDAKLSVKDVAKAADVSESYLYQLFREAGEISPKEYILDCRIHYACTLLKTRYYKVYEVAEKSGFSDPKYFMTAFKQKMGISPGRYVMRKTD